MSILSLIFSPAGAAIVVSITVIALVILFLCFTEKFRGLTASYKDIRVQIPEAKPPTSTPLEIVEHSPPALPAPVVDASPSEKDDASRDKPAILRLLDAVDARNRSSIEKILEELRPNPPFGLKPDEFETFALYQLVRAGFSDALQKLKDVEASQPEKSQASRCLAEHYIAARAFDPAQAHIEIAKQRAKTDGEKTKVALLQSRVIQLIGDKKDAADLLEKTANELTEAEERFRLLDEANKLFKDSHEEAKAIASLEKAVDCQPENIDARFRLAMMYAEITALKPLAVRQYNIILRQNPTNTGALNNIGILYGELGLPAQKVTEIRKAAELKDSHAIGNLASMLIDEGFLEEAQKMLGTATESDGERILFARQRLQSADSENEKNVQRLIPDQRN